MNTDQDYLAWRRQRLRETGRHPTDLQTYQYCRAELERLRALLARCNAFNALDCLEAKQADKDVRVALAGKEANDGRRVA